MATTKMAWALVLGAMGCATVAGPRPTGWVQDYEVKEIAQHFTKSTDCRPGTKDPHAFMCPLTAMRPTPFTPTENHKGILGIQLVMEINSKGFYTTFRLDRLLVLYARRRFGMTAQLAPTDGAEAAWYEQTVEALLAVLGGNRVPVVPPPGVARLLQIDVGKDLKESDFAWDWQPDRYFRVKNPAGGDVVVELSPLPGSRLTVAMFPLPSPPSAPQQAAAEKLRASLQAAYDVRRAASQLDDTKSPVSYRAIAWLRSMLSDRGVCSGGTETPELCAISTLGLGGAPLPRRGAVYAGLMYEAYATRDGWRATPLQQGTLALLGVGPGRFVMGTLGSDDQEEAEEIGAAAEALEQHLEGHAAGPIDAGRSVLKDVATFSRNAAPGTGYDHPSARLYEGTVPGGDGVYVVFAPRHGGGALIGLYPEVPWYREPPRPTLRTTEAFSR